MSEIKDGLNKTDGIRVNRRELIKRSLQIGGAAYVAPMVMASVAKVSAQTSPGPNPECAGATCSTFVACAANALCVCVRSSSGGGFCVDGSTSCSAIGNCGAAPGYACPAGSFCAVDTCCTVPVCVSFAASTVCQTGPAAASRALPNGPAGTMIGG
jgi:hypothetical protein